MSLWCRVGLNYLQCRIQPSTHHFSWWVVEFYVLATSKVIWGVVPFYFSAHHAVQYEYENVGGGLVWVGFIALTMLWIHEISTNSVILCTLLLRHNLVIPQRRLLGRAVPRQLEHKQCKHIPWKVFHFPRCYPSNIQCLYQIPYRIGW